MAVLEQLLLPHNIGFAVAVFLFLLIGSLQLVGFVLGSDLFSFMDDWLPDAAVGPGFLDSVLSMLKFGRVPFIITLLFALFAFACIGFNLQLLVQGFRGDPLSAGWASAAGFVLTLPVVRVGNQVLSRVLPRDETSVISEDDLVGLSGAIVLGTVTVDNSSEAKVADHLGREHYVQVVAENKDEAFQRGDFILLVRRQGHLYTVVADPALNQEVKDHAK